MLQGFEKGIGIPVDFVTHSTYWLVNENERILGVVNLRHRLNDKLLLKGGHIGYGIRPSERRKGCAAKILELCLLEAKKIGINRVLVTCDKENIASVKTITNNGGIFYCQNIIKGISIHIFWIENN